MIRVVYHVRKQGFIRLRLPSQEMAHCGLNMRPHSPQTIVVSAGRQRFDLRVENFLNIHFWKHTG